MAQHFGVVVAASLMIGGLMLLGPAMCQAAVVACTGAADDCFYAALGAEVFALPGLQTLVPVPTPASVL